MLFDKTTLNSSNFNIIAFKHTYASGMGAGVYTRTRNRNPTHLTSNYTKIARRKNSLINFKLNKYILFQFTTYQFLFFLSIILNISFGKK